MKLEIKNLDFDYDFPKSRARELGLFQLELKLPEGLCITGFDFKNRIIIRKSS